MTKTDTQPDEIPEEFQFVQDWVHGIPETATDDERLDTEKAAVEFAMQIENAEAKKAAANFLVRTIRHNSPALQQLIEEYEAERFPHKLIEATPDVLPHVLERLLDGRNPAVVIRAGTYEDFDTEILGVIGTQTGHELVETAKFPLETMDGQSSTLHLDNFLGSREPGFRYSLSASRVDNGRVLFLAGLTSSKAGGWDHTKYFEKVKLINQEPAVERLYEQATSDAVPAYRELSLKRHGVNLVAVTLGPGDIVIWPQGGPGSEQPAWHAVREVGNPQQPDYVPRETTSFHFAAHK